MGANSRGGMRKAVASVIVGVAAVASVAGAQGTTVGDKAQVSAPAERLAPPRSLHVSAGGDILAESPVREAAAQRAAGTSQRYDFSSMFAPLAAANADVDLAICHMELPIGRPGERAGAVGRSPFGGNLLLAPYELAAGVRAGGFDRCSTASNHSYDTGFSGVISTLDALDTAGITHAGTARTPAEAVPRAFDVGNIRVGHLSVTRYSNTVPPSDGWKQYYAASSRRVLDDVRTLRADGADIVIVSVHLLKEMLMDPIGQDREFAAQLTASGDVDLVVHHGPHVVQPLEIVNGTPVYWSTGNMMSGMGRPGSGRYADQRTLDGILATVRFVERRNGAWDVYPSAIAICTDPHTRIVRPARAWLDPGKGLDQRERNELALCLGRTEQVFGAVG